MTEDLKLSEQENAENESSEKGASLVEYVLLVALIAIVCILGLGLLGGALSKQVSAITGHISG